MHFVVDGSVQDALQTDDLDPDGNAGVQVLKDLREKKTMTLKLRMAEVALLVEHSFTIPEVPSSNPINYYKHLSPNCAPEKEKRRVLGLFYGKNPKLPTTELPRKWPNSSIQEKMPRLNILGPLTKLTLLS